MKIRHVKGDSPLPRRLKIPTEAGGLLPYIGGVSEYISTPDMPVLAHN
jgi:hypothetical protein